MKIISMMELTVLTVANCTTLSAKKQDKLLKFKREYYSNQKIKLLHVDNSQLVLSMIMFLI